MEPGSPDPGATNADWGIWGHGPAVASLQQMARANRIGHAYLFSGTHGLGKRLTGRQFAKALLCTEPVREDPAAFCGHCHACRRIDRDVHPDFVTYSLQTQSLLGKTGAKNTSLTIDTIREARAATALRPLEADRRIIAIDDAETMQDSAQEALLKTLEEPPSSVTLLLYASSAQGLLPTVRSRCHVIEFRPVSTGEIRAGLERGGASATVAQEIALLAHGNPAWAIAALASPALVKSQYEAVERTAEWIANGTYNRLITAVKLADRFVKQRDEVFNELEMVLRVWRDLLLRVAGLPERSEFPTADSLGMIAQSLSLPPALTAVQSVRQCLLDLDSNVRPRLALEGMVLQWPTPPANR